MVRGRGRMSLQVAAWIDEALVVACRGIEVPEQRRKLREAMLTNVDDGAEFPFPRLGVDFMSESEFFRRRSAMLDALFERMKLGRE